MEFPITFQDARDAELTWEWDDMHMPFALTPLAADYVLSLGAGMNHRYRHLGFPQQWKVAVWNGWAYFSHDMNVPPEEVADLDRRWADACRAQVPLVTAWWRDEALPELESVYRRISSPAVDDLAPHDLTRAWDDAWAAVLRAWELHFVVIMGPYLVMEDLADLYEAAIPDASPGEAMRLIAGSRHELYEVELATERLAELAMARPAVAERLRTPGTRREDLVSVHGGGEFVAALDAFLGEHGHLGQGFDDLGTPSWADDPSIMLAGVATRLDRPGRSAEERRSRLAAEADALADGVRSRLAEAPERLAAFEQTLANAREIGPLTEVHNYWIDRMAQARLHTLAMRVGGRFVREGRMEAPRDILYLHRAEVADAIATRQDLRDLITERKAEHEAQARVRPPRIVGKPRDANAPVDRFDGVRFESTVDDELRGTGASVGVVRGPARVVLSAEEFGRILPGDIIVCPSSNPSWVPVFTIAGGLVTNTGGVLSHAAVVAREFGLPAVVGTGDATERIADGRMVEIDGTRGTVRLL